jgi:hypothetical protein
MFRAAFTSRSCTVPHAPQVHSRTLSGFGPSFIPHAEHTWDVGSNRPTFPKARPCQRRALTRRRVEAVVVPELHI